MNDSELLENLESLAERLNVKIRYEQGDFHSGLCRVNDEQVIIVQKKIPDGRKAAAIAEALRNFDLGGLYILPKVRDFLAGETAGEAD